MPSCRAFFSGGAPERLVSPNKTRLSRQSSSAALLDQYRQHIRSLLTIAHSRTDKLQQILFRDLASVAGIADQDPVIHGFPGARSDVIFRRLAIGSPGVADRTEVLADEAIERKHARIGVWWPVCF